MAVCLDYQTVYFRRHREFVVSWRKQIVSVLVLLVVLSLKVSTRLSITSTGYQLHREQERQEVLNRQLRDLEYQLAVLTKHDHLRVEARERLGLGAVGRGQITRLDVAR